MKVPGFGVALAICLGLSFATSASSRDAAGWRLFSNKDAMTDEVTWFAQIASKDGSEDLSIACNGEEWTVSIIDPSIVADGPLPIVIRMSHLPGTEHILYGRRGVVGGVILRSTELPDDGPGAINVRVALQLILLRLSLDLSPQFLARVPTGDGHVDLDFDVSKSGAAIASLRKSCGYFPVGA